MKFFYLAILILFSSLCSSRGGDGLEIDFQGNRIGASDIHGAVSTWLDKRDWLVLKNLPLFLQFCSKQQYVANSVLGVGWYLPIFESNVTKIDEEHVRVATIYGAEFLLHKTGDKWISYDDSWTGSENGDDFKCEGPDGCQFVFKKGMISEAKILGEVLKWNRAVKNSVALSSGKSTIATFYLKDGLLERIEGPLLALNFEYQSYPVAIFDTVTGQASIIELKKTLHRILTPLGEVVSAEIGLQDEAKGYSMIIQGAEPLLESEKLTWDAKGHISSQQKYLKGKKDEPSESWQYSLGEKPPIDEVAAGGSEFPFIKRFNTKTNMLEWYYFDKSSAIEYISTEGDVIRSLFSFSPGGGFMKLRKIEMLPNQSKNWQPQEEYFYDAKGKLLREVYPGKTILHKRDGVKNESCLPIITYNSLNQIQSVKLPLSDESLEFQYKTSK